MRPRFLHRGGTPDSPSLSVHERVSVSVLVSDQRRAASDHAFGGSRVAIHDATRRLPCAGPARGFWSGGPPDSARVGSTMVSWRGYYAILDLTSGLVRDGD